MRSLSMSETSRCSASCRRSPQAYTVARNARLWAVCTQPNNRRTSSRLSTVGRRDSFLARRMLNNVQLRPST